MAGFIAGFDGDTKESIGVFLASLYDIICRGCYHIRRQQNLLK